MTRKFSCIVLLLLLPMFNTMLDAQDTTHTTIEGDGFEPKLFFQVGAYRPNVSTTLQLNGEYGPGTVLSLEDNLGFTSQAWLFRFEGVVKLSRRSGLFTNFVQLNRQQDWIVDRDIVIMDTTFHAGFDLGIKFNTTFVSLSYKYSMFAHPRWEAGFSGGIRFLYVKTGISYVSSNFNGVDESVNIPAPAPAFGIFGTAFITEKLLARYNFDYFTISISGIRGGVLDNRFGLEYYFFKNFGLGFSTSLLSYSVEDIPLAKNFDGEFRYTLYGFSALLSFRF